MLIQTVCGSFTNLLKLRVGGKSDGTASDCSSQVSEPDCALSNQETPVNSESGGNGTESKPDKGNGTTTATPVKRDVDLEGKLNSQIDKLDSMLMKAETADISMSKQNKEMRIFLNK
ncbi:hypothetical protein ANN_07040 [Periplaneta americana]|uniref:Uncharacterized protein n=1 Tax=Periplaneta americana TaxID=6978 RepID=A0ABQ8TFA9_PERAM|nr:hypothetical protein ANN_07040 [Periplaneta americana]